MKTVNHQTYWYSLAALLLLCTLGTGPLWGAPEPGGESSAAVGPKNESTGPQTLNDIARFIAGLRTPGSSLAASENRPVWTKYAGLINRGWENFTRRRLQPMQEWAAKELAAAPGSTVFYPFSGPDFINVYKLFPQAQTYLLVALEPVGKLPDFASRDWNNFFPKLERSLYDLLNLDFFITAKMANSIGPDELKGVLPVLLFFLGREQAQVLEVQDWVVRPDGGAAAAAETRDAGDIPGVRIVFQRQGAAAKQTLYYFRANLRNEALQRPPSLLAYLSSFGPLTTFTKAASYLMFKPHFSTIREFILAQSQGVLQTDSAIPLRYFGTAAWNLQFYGTYTTPIALFSKCYQPDLARIYKTGADIRPLPFGIGYRHRLHTSNLMLATRKPTVSPGTLVEDRK